MDPLEDPAKRRKKQGPKRRLAYRPRARLCLLKGCESWFEPECAQQRYCPGACAEAAAAWSAWKARRRYRRSPKGLRTRQKGNRQYRACRVARENLEGGFRLPARQGASSVRKLSPPPVRKLSPLPVWMEAAGTPRAEAVSIPGVEAASTPAETLPWVRLGAGIDPGIAAPDLPFAGLIAPPAIPRSGSTASEVPHGYQPVVVFAGGSRGSSLNRVGEISCDRPGCYELFMRTPRSPAQRFCEEPCRRAMERVWQREARWHARRGLG